MNGSDVTLSTNKKPGRANRWLRNTSSAEGLGKLTDTRIQHSICITGSEGAGTHRTPSALGVALHQDSHQLSCKGAFNYCCLRFGIDLKSQKGKGTIPFKKEVSKK